MSHDVKAHLFGHDGGKHTEQQFKTDSYSSTVTLLASIFPEDLITTAFTSATMFAFSAGKSPLSAIASRTHLGCSRQATMAGGCVFHPALSCQSFAIRSLVSRKKMVRGRMRRSKEEYRKPSLDIADAMPLSTQELDNSSLMMLAGTGDHQARREVLKRHIMTKDRVSYDQAEATYQEIDKKNREFMFALSLPYQLGIGVALVGAFASFPLVFDLGTAEWFNANYVTTEVPEQHDLETVLEVGSWTWNWMEPILGQVSFFLLCLQYSRSQIQNLGVKPYTAIVK